MPPLLGIYLGFKAGDMVIRETFVYLAEFNTASVMFTLEVVGGVIIPLRMFLSPAVRKSPPLLFTAALLCRSRSAAVPHQHLYHGIYPTVCYALLFP